MTRQRKIKCSVCGKALFFLPANYTMSFPVVCINCGEGKEAKEAKSKVPTTAASLYARVKKGVRQDVHPTYSFRSATEANFARIMKYLGIGYKFEERVFPFDSKNAPHQYIPDFELTFRPDVTEDNREFVPGWYEIKGWMDGTSRNKLRKFKSNYPGEADKFTVIVYRRGDKTAIDFCKKMGFRYLCYDELTEKFSHRIKGWE